MASALITSMDFTAENVAVTTSIDAGMDFTLEYENTTFDFYNLTTEESTTLVSTTVKRPPEIPVVTGTRYATGIIMSIIICVSIFGNVVVLAAIARTKALQRVNTMMYSSLSVSDLIRTIVCMPIFTFALYSNKWNIPDLFCPLYHVFYIMVRFVCVLTVTMISMERAFIITQPLQYQRIVTPSRMRNMIIAIWLLSAVYGSLNSLWFVLYEPLDDNEGGTFFQPDTYDVNIPCRFEPAMEYAIVDFFLTFLIPLVIIFVAYIKIFRVVSYQMKRIIPKISEPADAVNGVDMQRESTFFGRPRSITDEVEAQAAAAQELNEDSGTGRERTLSIVSASDTFTTFEDDTVPPRFFLGAPTSAILRKISEENLSHQFNIQSDTDSIPIEGTPKNAGAFKKRVRKHNLFVRRVSNPCANSLDDFSDSNEDTSSDSDDNGNHNNNNNTPSQGQGDKKETSKIENQEASTRANDDRKTRKNSSFETKQQVGNGHLSNQSNTMLPNSIDKDNHEIHAGTNGYVNHVALEELNEQDTTNSASTTKLKRKKSALKRKGSNSANKNNVHFRLFHNIGRRDKSSTSTGKTESRRKSSRKQQNKSVTQSTELNVINNNNTIQKSDSGISLQSAETIDGAQEHTEQWANKHFQIETNKRFQSRANSLLVPESHHQTRINSSGSNKSSRSNSAGTIHSRRRSAIPGFIRSRTESTHSAVSNRSTYSSSLKKSWRLIRNNKAIKLTVAVVGTFILCWAPFEITFLVERACPNCVSDVLWFIVNTLAFMSSAINPFVYSLYSTEFRTAVKNLLTCCKKDPMDE